MPSGFKFGDHQFYHPTERAPIDRGNRKKRINGAPPPTYLEGLVRPSTKKSKAAADMLDGEFCGHGEPTFTLWDVVIDGEETPEIHAILPEGWPDTGDPTLVVARSGPGAPWHILFDRNWTKAQLGLEGVTQRELTPEELSQFAGDPDRAYLSIGLEYGCDSETRDSVSWLCICIREPEGEDNHLLVNAEMD